jgi:type I restriction enzyme, S subunit
MSWPAYPSYKESGVEWLGGVPSHWSVDRIKWSVESSRNGIWGEEADGGPHDIRCVRVADFDRPRLSIQDRDVTYRSVTPQERERRLLGKGDLILEKSGGGEKNPVGFVVLYDQNEPAVTSNFLARVSLRPGMEPRFWTYLHSSLYRSRLTQPSIKQTSGIQNLDQQSYFDERVCFPPSDEQRLISDWLDAETSSIDALIAKQEQLVAALKERRSITADLILDRHGFTAPRSLADLESATPPHGWQIIHLGTVLRQLTNGFVGPTRDILVDEGVPYVQSTHIKQGQIDFSRRPFHVRQEWHDERPRIHLREGDVLIVQTGDIGKVAVVPPEFGEASCHALQIARVKPEILSGNYLGAFLGSWVGYHYLCSLATGALHPHLEGGIRAVPVVVPPLDVQTMIVRQVDEQTAKIDALIAKATEVIDALHEYRSALITDAVTGKIDVRGAT